MVRDTLAALDGLILIGTALMQWLMPSITRRDLLFGATVAPDARETPRGRALVRRYRVSVLVLTLLLAAALAVAFVAAPSSWWYEGWLAIVGIIPVFVLMAPYFFAHQAARAFAAPSEAPQPGQVAELRPRRYRDLVPLAWETLPLATIVATAAYLGANYQSAPAIIPTHFGPNGVANAYAAKTVGTYFIAVWVQLGIEALITVLSVLSVAGKAQPDVADARFRRRTLRAAFGVKELTLLLLAGTAVASAQAAAGNTGPVSWLLPATLAFVAIVLVGAIVLSLATGQGGSRLPHASSVDRMDDRYWKLGIFYVNPKDPSIVVERRFGYGWTINLGNPWGVVVILGLVAVVVAASVVPIVLSGSH